jgi:hypothetical protein
MALCVVIHAMAMTLAITTIGYGDLVLTGQWRLLGAVEALTGILMCGWSTGFFFTVLDRMFEARAPRHS